MGTSITVDVELAYTPPSLNQNGTSISAGAGHRFRRAKKELENDLGMLFVSARRRMPQPWPVDFLRVEATLRFPTRRRRDEGNYRALLEKSAGDAAQYVGLLEDDTPELFEFGSLRFDPELGPRRTILHLTIGRP
jgi:hypothetical protein